MNSKLIQLISLALAGLLVWASTAFVPSINAGRRQLNMIGAERPEQSAPPEYAFAVQAFGAFRGILTNIAFIRAEQFKQDGRYFDAMQLASWICKLQPRFPSVWEFHAWNMAWNISVTTYTPEERWNWVYNGAKLLRDEGIRYNPKAVNLYKQLAWIFNNKMGETTDEQHLAYKRNWAWRMHLLLGNPPDPLGQYRPDKPFVELSGKIGDDTLARSARRSRELENETRKAEGKPPLPLPDIAAPTEPVVADREPNAPAAPTGERPSPSAIAKRAVYDFTLSIAAAPDTLAALYAAAPEAREIVQTLGNELNVRINDDDLDEDRYWNDTGLAFTFFARYRRLQDVGQSQLYRTLTDKDRQDLVSGDDPIVERFDQIVGVRAARPAALALERFLQKKVLREVYKMQADEMARLVDVFGPLDWRSVDAHALYWLNRGLIEGAETIGSFKNDKTNTARLVFFCLRNSFQRNRIVFEPFYADIAYSYFNVSPDLNFIDPLHQAYLTYGPLLDPTPGPGAGDTYRTGHANFLSDAVRLLYFADRIPEATYYFDYLRETYGRNPDGTLNPLYMRTVHDYAVDSFYDSDMDWRATRDFIAGLVVTAYNDLARGDDAKYAALLTQARRAHVAYHYTDIPDKMKFPPFREMAADLLRFVLLRPPAGPLDTPLKARLWERLPIDLRQIVYDDVLPALTKECAMGRFDVTRAFAEPPGMEEYRRLNPHRGPEKKDAPAETPAQQLK